MTELQALITSRIFHRYQHQLRPLVSSHSLWIQHNALPIGSTPRTGTSPSPQMREKATRNLPQVPRVQILPSPYHLKATSKSTNSRPKKSKSAKTARKLIHSSPTHTLTSQNSQRRKSSLAEKIAGMPPIHQYHLNQLREEPIENHSSPLRRLPDPNVQDPLAPLSSPKIQVQNPVQEPNWPDTAFTKPLPQDPILASEISDKLDTWICGDAECATKNKKDAKACVQCGQGLPDGVYVTKIKLNKNREMEVRVPEELALRDMGGGRAAVKQHLEDKEDRPVGDAEGGGKWIPKRKYT